jgi:hypothetical protein
MAQQGSMTLIMAVAIADLKQRLREPRLFQGIVFFVLMATVMIPSKSASYATLSSPKFVAESTSGMVGTTIAVLVALMLLVFGPFLTHGAILRDRISTTGEILAGTLLKPWQYLSGKFISNLVLLSLIAMVVQGTVALTFPLRGVGPLTIVDFLAPLLLVCGVSAIVAAAVGVLWETLRFSQRPWSGLVYIVLALLVTLGGAIGTVWFDPSGLGAYTRQLSAIFPAFSEFSFGFVPRVPRQLSVVLPGIVVTQTFLLQRSLWLLLTGGILLLCTLLWREEPSAGKARPQRVTATAITQPAIVPLTMISPLPAGPIQPSLVRMSLAELRISLPRSRWFLACIVGVWLGAFGLPLAWVRQFVTPVALLLLLPLLAPLAAREAIYDVTALIYSLPKVEPNYILWKSLAGSILMLGVIGGLCIRFAVQAPSAAFSLFAGGMLSLGWLIFLAHLRSRTQAGTISLGLLWYIVSWNTVPAWLDYAGIHSTPADWAMSCVHLGIGVALLLLAALVQRVRSPLVTR